MKKILLLTTGGTIACIKSNNGLTPGINGKLLLEKIPEIKSICDVTIKGILNIDSSNMYSKDWKVIAKEVYEGSKEFDGIVITHGTDTMAYTTSMISFMVQNLNIPVVFTGSQIPMDEEGSDADSNLLEAFKVAVSDITGVSLVFNGKVIKGTRAFKIHSLNHDAFVSCNYPYIGKFKDGILISNKKNRNIDKKVCFYQNICDKVFLLKLIPGMNPAIIDFILSEGYKGVVIETFGLGGIPSQYNNLIDKLEKLINKYNIPVIAVSQCVYDGADLNVYSVGIKAEKAGVISGKDMTTEAAVTKLMWILGQEKDYADIKSKIVSNICDEINLNI